ncbi:hypothetical protein NNL21_29410 [Paenibacillus mendelii]|nr:hypothetical protein [Paenibacillus mendelii]
MEPDTETEGAAPLIDGPEYTFWGSLEWSILFHEGSLEICKPHGVMVNFHDTSIIGFVDLSVQKRSD